LVRIRSCLCDEEHRARFVALRGQLILHECGGRKR
jgi:hypothetical protein